MAWAERVYKQDTGGEEDSKRSRPTSVSGERHESFGADTKVTEEVPPEIPPMFRAEPAVREAELIVQGRSTSRPITDGRVVR